MSDTSTIVQGAAGVALIVVGVAITFLSYGWAAPVGAAFISPGAGMAIGRARRALKPRP